MTAYEYGRAAACHILACGGMPPSVPRDYSPADKAAWKRGYDDVFAGKRRP